MCVSPLGIWNVEEMTGLHFSAPVELGAWFWNDRSSAENVLRNAEWSRRSGIVRAEKRLQKTRNGCASTSSGHRLSLQVSRVPDLKDSRAVFS
jgi:hypothetical protein